jgi:hypothetical protein
MQAKVEAAAAAKKPIVKKMALAKKPMAKKAAARPAAKNATFVAKPEPGYNQSKGGVLVPAGSESRSYVTTGKLQAGIESAKDQIKGTLQNIAAVFTQDFEVSEIELSVTFTADGKFLGFGTGGAMSVKVKISPTKDVYA